MNQKTPPQIEGLNVFRKSLCKDCRGEQLPVATT